MSLRLTNLSLPVEEPEANLPTQLARAVGVPPADIDRWRILRKALDVRDKRQLRFVYNFEVTLQPGVSAKASHIGGSRVEPFDEPPFAMPPPGAHALPHRPVVIGSGPGGLVCGYFLAQQGYRPIVLERGTIVSERIRDVKRFDAGGEFDRDSNYLFGEGGAGTFSDGKLTCRGSGADFHRVLELLAECKGQQEGRENILYYHRPHLGSNRLPAVVKAMRRKIEEFGGEVRFRTTVEDLHFDANGVTGVATSGGFIPASVVILAIGHSARDSYEMLARRGVPMTRKPFQFGVRIEHRQDVVNEVQYGWKHQQYEDTLGNADYSLVAHGQNDLFTFCMCAGGYIIPSVSDEGYFCTNGMSLSKRDSPFANSGLVVTVPLEAFEGDDVLAGVRLQQKYERMAFELGRGRYAAPAQRASDFLAGRATPSLPKTSYPRDVVATDLNELLPPVVAAAVRHGLPQMDRRWQGRFLADAMLFGPEARGSSPVRIDRDNVTRESPGIPGLFPVGEGAGYAGGIVSAAVDGLRTAKAVVAKYAAVTTS
ncbi:NAD(P)/FAD-dependent oxidoreductase [Limnoglobus roseus]|uniref:FAD-dependent oxidoreductase n=1 Tax=Limnoglobus roseus TaxID=2598579 RepID=A0A5C1AM17_9BACT|nr:NAD(P)-binding protein [Limnoglobus roseus]QEL20261.1 FAD-dependent oxidoreductase [Limnoglobus roseus]